MTTTCDTLPSEAPAAAGAADDTTADQPAGYGVLRWLVLATFIVILNETIMINAIPRLMGEFEVSARSAQWLSTAFMLAMATVIPVTGWFLQRVTTRAAFATAMLVFCTGTLLAALAPTFPVLLGARVVQAAGTAVMMPLLMTTLMTVVPAHDRGRVMGNVTLAMSCAPALGPAVSGVVLQWLSWRWMFGLVLPVAAAITVVGLRRLTNHGETQAGSIDWFSVAAAAFGFGGFVYGLSQLGAESSALVSPYAMIGVGLAAIAVFVVRQLVLQRSDRPLLDLRTLRHPTFAVSLALMSVAFMAMLGSMILLPLYLQDVRGLNALQTGLLVMPGGLVMGVMGPSVGRWFDRLGSRPLVIPGSVGIVTALALLTTVGRTTPVALVLVAHVLLMVSLAAVFTPVFTVGLGALPPHLYSHGSSLLGTLQQVAAAVGTAVVVTVMSWRAAELAQAGSDPMDALVGGMQWAFGIGAVLAVGVLVLAFRLPRRTPAQGTGEPVPEAAA
ncbi:MAG: multidrug efflux MFS transporter [Nocardioidaceae bacterium]|nr:multidrug efflux MFS transporter [Nocardioidaceae bacterium]